MGVSRKQLRRAEKAHYALKAGHYLSGTPVGEGGKRAQIRLGYVAPPKAKKPRKPRAKKADPVEASA